MTKHIVALVESHGFKLQRQKNHYVFKHPSGKVFVCGKTLSDKRALMNIRKEVVRILMKGWPTPWAQLLTSTTDYLAGEDNIKCWCRKVISTKCASRILARTVSSSWVLIGCVWADCHNSSWRASTRSHRNTLVFRRNYAKHGAYKQS